MGNNQSELMSAPLVPQSEPIAAFAERFCFPHSITMAFTRSGKDFTITEAATNSSLFRVHARQFAFDNHCEVLDAYGQPIAHLRYQEHTRIQVYSTDRLDQAPMLEIRSEAKTASQLRLSFIDLTHDRIVQLGLDGGYRGRYAQMWIRSTAAVAMLHPVARLVRDKTTQKQYQVELASNVDSALIVVACMALEAHHTFRTSLSSGNIKSSVFNHGADVTVAELDPYSQPFMALQSESLPVAVAKLGRPHFVTLCCKELPRLGDVVIGDVVTDALLFRIQHVSGKYDILLDADNAPIAHVRRHSRFMSGKSYRVFTTGAKTDDPILEIFPQAKTTADLRTTFCDLISGDVCEVGLDSQNTATFARIWLKRGVGEPRVIAIHHRDTVVGRTRAVCKLELAPNVDPVLIALLYTVMEADRRLRSVDSAGRVSSP